MPSDDRSASPELKAILDAAGTMIIATDLEGVVRVFNPAAERLLGWSAAEVVGRHTLALWHDEEEIAARAAELSRDHGRAIAPGFEVLVIKAREQFNEQREWTYIRRDGNRFPVQLVVSAIRDSAGTITGYVGTAQDLTDRVRAEEERDRLFNHSLDMLGVAGTDGYFKRINPAFRRTLGWDEEEILSRPFVDLVHPEDRTATVREVEKLASGQPSLHFENRYRCKDGSWRWLAWRTMPQPDGHLFTAARDVTQHKQNEKIIDPAGAHIGYVHTLTDVTRQKQTEQALRLLASDLATMSGVAFYEAVVRHLAELLNCEMAFICRPDPAQLDQLVTLAMFADGEIRPNFSYPITGTPLEHVVGRRSCIIPSGVREKYAEDMFLSDHHIEAYVSVPFIDAQGHQFGHIGVMSRRPLTQPDTVESITNFFAISVVAEFERQLNERRFSDLFNLSTDAMLITNRDGTIVQANRQVTAVFGWTPAELVGQPIEVLVPADLREGHIRLREDYLESPSPRPIGNSPDSLSGLRKDGSSFPIEVRFSRRSPNSRAGSAARCRRSGELCTRHKLWDTETA